MEYLADKHPAVREELNTVLATSPQSGTRQDDYGSLLPAPKPPTPGASGASLRDAAPDPLEDPQGYAMYVAQLTAAEYRKLAQAEAATQRKQSQDYQLQIEAAEVEREVNAFISPKGEPHAPDYFSGVPGDVVAEAANIVVNVYGIPIDRPGGPTRRFHAFVNEVKRIMSERNMNQRQTELAGQASQQAGQVMKMAVPSAVGAVTPGDKSPEKKHLESMMGVSGTALSDLMQKPG